MGKLLTRAQAAALFGVTKHTVTPRKNSEGRS